MTNPLTRPRPRPQARPLALLLLACHPAQPADTDTTTTTTTDTTASETTASTSSPTTTTSSSTSTTTAAPFCGDGVQDPGEECDDGQNNADNAACTASCLLNVCGDGLLLSSVEECDDGQKNADNAACTASCRLAFCGDGLLWDAAEACDDPDPAAGCQDCSLLPLTVFVSSAIFPGKLPPLQDLQGLPLADAHCQLLAASAGLSGAYMAWLSDASQGPSSRFLLPQASPRPFVLTNGATLAQSWTSLTQGPLLLPIDTDEAAQNVGSSSVWTNTTPQGDPASQDAHCSAWSSSDFKLNGRIGATTKTDPNWTNFAPMVCSGSARIYCFQVAF
ncbi:MAG: hypothetical protein IPK80_04305 [Nannocystis sp.]|nr:hypothetical protein [Nannocystis sp.]